MNTGGQYIRVIYDYHLRDMLLHSLQTSLGGMFYEKEKIMLLEDTYMLYKAGVIEVDFAQQIYQVICRKHSDIITCEKYLDYSDLFVNKHTH